LSPLDTQNVLITAIVKALDLAVCSSLPSPGHYSRFHPPVLRILLTMHWFSLLSVFATASIGLANPIAPRWDDMKVKHSWGSVPNKWEYHGHPPDDAIIDLRVALKPHRENALIDALYEVSDPGHPKCVRVFVSLVTLYAYLNASPANTDTVRTYPRSKSPNSLRPIRTQSNSSAPGWSTTMCPPLWSHSRTAVVG
jgi:hypothetical protein